MTVKNVTKFIVQMLCQQIDLGEQRIRLPNYKYKIIGVRVQRVAFILINEQKR